MGGDGHGQRCVGGELEQCGTDDSIACTTTTTTIVIAIAIAVGCTHVW